MARYYAESARAGRPIDETLSRMFDKSAGELMGWTRDCLANASVKSCAIHQTSELILARFPDAVDQINTFSTLES